MTKKPTKKTTKKPSTKKAPTKRRKHGPTSRGHVNFLVRTPPEIKQWLEDTAHANGMSRDGFIRTLFATAHATWNEADQDAQLEMFNEISSFIDQAVRRAVVEAVNNSPSVVVARGLGKPRINSKDNET